MKKFIILLNDCFLNFWFGILMLVLIFLSIIWLNPYSLVMYIGRSGEFSNISSVLWSSFIYFLLLAVLSIILSLFIWLRGKMGSSYRGLASLIISITALASLFILEGSLSILHYKINGGDFDYPSVGGPADSTHQKTAD